MKRNRAGLGAPAVIVAGECAALGADLEWYERMPLFGRRIIVTRAVEDAGGTDRSAARARRRSDRHPGDRLGGAVELCGSGCGDRGWSDRSTGSSSPVRKASRRSCNGCGSAATIFASWLARSIAAIGPATAARLGDFALTVTAMPREYRAERLIDALTPARIQGARILIPRAEVAREVLAEDAARGRGARGSNRAGVCDSAAAGRSRKNICAAGSSPAPSIW